MSDDAAPRRTWPGVLGGLALTLVLHVLAAGVVAAAGILSGRADGGAWILYFLVFIGAAQWVYVAPAALSARYNGWHALAKGLWIGGALGTLLSGLCWGSLFLAR